MGITIDENILLGAAAVIFVPLFVFFIKLIIEMGAIKGRLEAMCGNIQEHKKAVDEMIKVQSDINLIKLRLDNIENQMRTKGGSPMS